MFKDFRSGYTSLFIDVPDNKRCKAFFFCKTHYRHCAFAHLAYAARSRADISVKHCLYRVNYHNIRRQSLNVLHHLGKSSLCQNIYLAFIYAESLSAHFELALAFFAGYVKYFLTGFGQTAKLQQQR